MELQLHTQRKVQTSLLQEEINRNLPVAKEELERLYNIKVLPVQADVSAGADNETVVQHVIDETIAKFGRIDVLINNAQASASGVTLADHTTEQFDLALYSGLYACILLYESMLPSFERDKRLCH